MERIRIQPIQFGVNRQLTAITIIQQKLVFGTERNFIVQCFDNNGQLSEEVNITLSNEEYFAKGETTEQRIESLLADKDIKIINSP